MTDYATTVKARRHQAIKIRPDLYTRYEGSENNSNWHCILYVRKDVTQAANNDTVTLTVS